MNPPSKQYCTVKEAAEYFAISKRLLYKLIEQGRVPAAIRLDRAIRLDLEAVEKALLATGDADKC